MIHDDVGLMVHVLDLFINIKSTITSSTSKLCVWGLLHISQSDSETLTDEGNGTYTTDLDLNSDSIDLLIIMILILGFMDGMMMKMMILN